MDEDDKKRKGMERLDQVCPVRQGHIEQMARPEHSEAIVQEGLGEVSSSKQEE